MDAVHTARWHVRILAGGCIQYTLMFRDDRREKFGQVSAYRDRAASPIAASVRRREVLCRFRCMMSKPSSAGLTMPIKALKFAPSPYINPASIMDKARHLQDVLIKETERVWVG